MVASDQHLSLVERRTLVLVYFARGAVQDRRTVANASAKNPQDAVTEARRKIARFSQELDRKTHFEIFGADRDTDLERIRDTYRTLAKQWHTDAYAGMDLGPEQETLDQIFKRITSAYETLNEPKKRAEYLVYLDRRSKGLSTDVNEVLEAERLFDEALIKIRRKDWKGAERQLAEARAKNPEDQLIVVHVAWCQYNQNSKSKDTARESVEMLKRATKAQENLPLAWQYMGQIFFNLNQPVEAKKCWKRCLEWEPNNVDANRGIRLLTSREQKPASGLGAFVNKLLRKK
jgi:tetratricopeptide (TPR) repeat protein